MSLNYQRIVERYPKLNRMVGGSIPSREICFLLDGKNSQVATRLLCSKKIKKQKMKLWLIVAVNLTTTITAFLIYTTLYKKSKRVKDCVWLTEVQFVAGNCHSKRHVQSQRSSQKD